MLTVSGSSRHRQRRCRGTARAAGAPGSSGRSRCAFADQERRSSLPQRAHARPDGRTYHHGAISRISRPVWATTPTGPSSAWCSIAPFRVFFDTSTPLGSTLHQGQGVVGSVCPPLEVYTGKGFSAMGSRGAPVSRLPRRCALPGMNGEKPVP